MQPIAEIPSKKFKLTETEIHYDGTIYPLSAVKHLFFLVLETEQQSKTTLSARMDIDFATRCNSISITYDEQRRIGFNKNLKQEIEDLKLIFIKLSEMTREIRLSKYLNELDKLGYFRYGDSYIFPRNKFMIEGKEYSANEFHFYNIEGTIYLKRKSNNNNLWKKLINYCFDPKDLNFRIDRDIIFTILEDKCYWKWNE